MNDMTELVTTNFQLATSLPTITLVAANGKLMALDWHTQKTEKLLNRLKAQSQFIDINELANHLDNPNVVVLIETIKQLGEYFVGKRDAFDVPLDLSSGTPFQQTVWQALLKIPYGKTISYAQLANIIGKPTACRAVANANGKNPISLIIPCHRVIASDGGLGGYTGGIDIKQQLLALEQTT